MAEEPVWYRAQRLASSRGHASIFVLRKDNLCCAYVALDPGVFRNAGRSQLFASGDALRAVRRPPKCQRHLQPKATVKMEGKASCESRALGQYPLRPNRTS